MIKIFLFEKTITVVFLLIVIAIALSSFFITPDYSSYQISDWMINYQGGFVRRGLAGQILWFLHGNYIKTSPIITILLIESVFFVLFLFIILSIFKKYKWSMTTAIFPTACCVASLAEYRRDFMMLYLCYVTFCCFFKYLSNKKKKLLVLSVAIMSGSILLYEPVFFSLIPILLIQYWHSLSKRSTIKVLRTTAVFIIPILSMLISCIYNGTKKQSDIIWESWLPIIKPFIGETSIEKGYAIDFLSLSNVEVFNHHIGLNFGTTPLNITFSLVILFIVFSCFYYLCTYIPVIDNRNKILSVNDSNNRNKLGRILIFQLSAQLPLFTFLSCDYGRTIPFSIFTTYFIYHISKMYNIKINVISIINRSSTKINNIFTQIKILQHHSVYFIIMLAFPLKIWPTPFIYDNIIYHVFIKINKYILNYAL